MENTSQQNGSGEAQEFFNDFQKNYPHLSVLVTLDEVATHLEQPHIKQWDSHPNKELIKNFKLGIYAEHVVQVKLREVSY